MIIIGITGTIGAGKGTIVDYLIEKYQFEHFSVRKYLSSIIQSKGLEVNRDTMTITANALRADNNSPSFLIEELYRQAKESNKNCIIESIRTIGEIETLRSRGKFILLAVDADQSIRYERIWNRKSETDRISFETFVENEEREMQSEDPKKQNLGGCIALADYTLTNNGDVESLKNQIDQIFLEILK